MSWSLIPWILVVAAIGASLADVVTHSLLSIFHAVAGALAQARDSMVGWARGLAASAARGYAQVGLGPAGPDQFRWSFLLGAAFACIVAAVLVWADLTVVGLSLQALGLASWSPRTGSLEGLTAISLVTAAVTGAWAWKECHPGHVSHLVPPHWWAASRRFLRVMAMAALVLSGAAATSLALARWDASAVVSEIDAQGDGDFSADALQDTDEMTATASADATQRLKRVDTWRLVAYVTIPLAVLAATIPAVTFGPLGALKLAVPFLMAGLSLWLVLLSTVFGALGLLVRLVRALVRSILDLVFGVCLVFGAPLRHAAASIYNALDRSRANASSSLSQGILGVLQAPLAWVVTPPTPSLPIGEQGL